ncbi:hypothetical protein [Streptomyces sp. NPDC060198]|uniref:hypothetical protein n=1 Tax=Streptomyces sp. NPDC060198 TaxID=3347070 RepID=UPI00366A0E03
MNKRIIFATPEGRSLGPDIKRRQPFLINPERPTTSHSEPPALDTRTTHGKGVKIVVTKELFSDAHIGVTAVKARVRLQRQAIDTLNTARQPGDHCGGGHW